MKIVCICGAGVGSSLLVKMGIERVLARNGYDERDFIYEQADLQTGRGMAMFCDLIVTTPAFESSLDMNGKPYVLIQNLFSEKEIEEKLIPVIQKMMPNKKNPI
jgi:PTS system ascorbate-specific IIB component